MDIKKKDIMFGNFIGGLAWGLGTVIGATLIFALLVWILRIINVVPGVGNFVGGVLEVVNERQLTKP